MTREEVKEKIVKIAAEKLGVDPSTIQDSSKYVEDLGADSLGLVDITMALEDAFGTSIPDEDLEKIASINQTIDYILGKLG